MKTTAIIYHYLAHYRLPIFQELMKSEVVEYTIFSGKDSEIEIKKVEESIAAKDIDTGGLRWFFLKNKWLFNNRFLWQSGLIKEVLKNQFDAYIFLGSPYHISTWLAVIIVRLKNKKAYFWMHGIYKDKLKFIDYIKLLIFYKMVNGYFLYGNRAARILKKYNNKSKRSINVIYNSLDYKRSLNLRISKINTNKTYHFRETYFKSVNLPTVCFIGRINSIKRIDLLIEAQKIVFEKYNNSFFNIVIIGEGEEKIKLSSLAKSYNLSNNIHFTGAIYDEKKIADILSYSDICITPGEVGLTAIHAMSYGTPVISHNELNVQMPEIEAIKQGISGDLFEYGSVNDLVEKIVDWFNLYPIKTQLVSDNCMGIIDDYYNPNYQLKIFDTVLNK